VLVEDVTVNRMADALDLFESICNAPLLKNISMVLLLNKMDVLHKKLKHTMVSTYFPDFKGQQDARIVARYFTSQFALRSKRTKQDGYVSSYCTTATDTNTMRVIVNAVLEGVMKSNLTEFGII
ncbi:hypothetical protein HDU91_001979, partial [Kappamyces sp. JEL0680]